MKWKRSVGVIVMVGMGSIGSAFAQSAGCVLDVLAYSARPGGPNALEAYVQVRNRGPYSCRVRVDRMLANPPAHQSCPGCTFSTCGTAPEGNTVCKTENTTQNLELAPCSASASQFCKSTNDCMPGASAQASACCDCRTISSSCNGVCAGTSGEFCSHYGDVLVTLTEEKAPGKGQSWQQTQVIVCASGGYRENYPEAPECGIQSYCDEPFGSRSYRAPCTQLGPFENCVVM
jgi:hypothetical protein